VRAAAQPRYHLEMALLRWIYLRKIVPIEDLIAGTPNVSRNQSTPASTKPAAPSPLMSQAAVAASRAATARVLANAAPGTKTPGTTAPGTVAPSTLAPRATAPGSLKDTLLSEIRKSKQVFYNMVVAQAQKIEVAGDRVTFTFAPNQRTLRDTFE